MLFVSDRSVQFVPDGSYLVDCGRKITQNTDEATAGLSPAALLLEANISDSSHDTCSPCLDRNVGILKLGFLGV